MLFTISSTSKIEAPLFLVIFKSESPFTPLNSFISRKITMMHHTASYFFRFLCSSKLPHSNPLQPFLLQSKIIRFAMTRFWPFRASIAPSPNVLGSNSAGYANWDSYSNFLWMLSNSKFCIIHSSISLTVHSNLEDLQSERRFWSQQPTSCFHAQGPRSTREIFFFSHLWGFNGFLSTTRSYSFPIFDNRSTLYMPRELPTERHTDILRPASFICIYNPKFKTVH